MNGQPPGSHPHFTVFAPPVDAVHRPTQEPACWADLVAIEPRLIGPEREAERVARRFGRRRSRAFWLAYEGIKQRASKLVGWHSRRPAVATADAYEIATVHLYDVCCSGPRQQIKPGRAN